ncbi:neuropeptide FF receptor 2-like [Exaiptasia diaphana]|uniref:G-protein coupled receptors family 1 profile domain-containing protein n=1 Tax=Exaiptasia diaphana TaxID=2652724 RepID=A0A913Y7I7_EXADI|nr:neuropeptide FF receptor 2-like [Exaiptasia diaphana]
MNNTTSTQQPSSVHPDLLTTVQLVFYAVLFFLGGVGNILVLLVIRAKKRITRRNNDYFIFNLAVGDILVLFVSIPVDFYVKLLNVPYGYVICKFLWPLMTSGLLASIFTLTCMAVERARVVCKPIAPKLQGMQLLAVILMMWIAAVICVLPLAIVAVPDVNSGACHEKWPYMVMRKIYTAALTGIQYIIPLVIITIAYSMLSYRLKVSRQFRIDSIATSEYSIEYRQNIIDKHRNESSKINKNLRTIVILFAIFILPKQVVWLWLDFGGGGSSDNFHHILVFAEVMLYIHSASNPVVYGTIMRDYRQGFKKYLRRLFCCCHMQYYHVHGCSVKGKISPAHRIPTVKDNYYMNPLH